MEINQIKAASETIPRRLQSSCADKLSQRLLGAAMPYDDPPASPGFEQFKAMNIPEWMALFESSSVGQEPNDSEPGGISNHEHGQQTISDASIASTNGESILCVPNSWRDRTDDGVTAESTSEPFHVAFRAPVAAQLPSKSDERRFNALVTATGDQMAVTLTGSLEGIKELRVEATMVTSYEGQLCHSVFRFDIREPERHAEETYCITSVPIKKMGEGEYVVSLGELSVCKTTNDQLYFGYEGKKKGRSQYPHGKYQLRRYPSGELLPISCELGLNTFFRKRKLDAAMLAIRLFANSSNTPLSIVRNGVKDNILLSNILTMESKPEKAAKRKKKAKPKKGANQTTSLPPRENRSSDDSFDAQLATGTVAIPDQTALIATSATTPNLHHDFGTQEESTEQRVENLGLGSQQPPQKRGTCETDAPNAEPPAPKKMNITDHRVIKVLVKSLDTWSELSVHLKPTDQIRELKRQIEEQWHIGPSDQLLILASNATLSDEQTLQDCGGKERILIFLNPSRWQ